MKVDRRQERHRLLKAIQERSATYEIQHVMELLDLLLSEARDNLVNCSAEDFPRLQGEAQTYDKLIRQLTRPSVKDLMAGKE
jgi:hypothetical protein